MAACDRKISISAETTVNMVMIQIPESSARNILKSHFDKIRKSNRWLDALIFFVPFTLSFFTSDFSEKKIFGVTIPTEYFQALFTLLWLAALCYFIYTIFSSIKNKDSVDKIIKDLKESKEC